MIHDATAIASRFARTVKSREFGRAQTDQFTIVPSPWQCTAVREVQDPSVDLPPRKMLTISEAARGLSVGRSTVYTLLNSGSLSSVIIGRLRRIPIDSLEDFLSSLQVAPSGPAGTE